MIGNPLDGISRRSVLRASVGIGAVTTLAGCGEDNGTDTETENDTETPSGTITLGLPDGATECIEPVEGDQSVAEYYAFDADGNRSANVPAELLVDDATVTFVYRNTETDARSLVVVNGNPDSDANADGVAPVTFEGVDGYEWQVQDGPSDVVPYTTGDGAFDGPETALWNWPRDRTDGGALGPLGESFDVTITHLASGTVRDNTMDRTGLDRWLFVDGADTESPIEVTTFEEDTGDVSVSVSAGCE